MTIPPATDESHRRKNESWGRLRELAERAMNGPQKSEAAFEFYRLISPLDLLALLSQLDALEAERDAAHDTWRACYENATARAHAAEARAERAERELAEEKADALRFRYLLEHRSHHYGMDMAAPSPAEWGISWDYQQIKPGEQFLSIRSLIDQDIAALDEEARADLSTPNPVENNG